MKENFKLNSPYDGLGISVMAIVPDGQVDAVLQLSHGMNGHKERYAPLMDYLAARGIACVASDHRGHGGSVRKPSDLGYMYKAGADAFVEDLHLVNGWCHEHFPGKPVFLLGHSMGSLLAVMYAKKYDSSISGLFLCGIPATQPTLWSVTVMLKLLSLVSHGRLRVHFLQTLADRRLNRYFPAEGPMAWTCSDPQVRISFAHDPLSGFTASVDASLSLLEMMAAASSDDGWRTSRHDIPVYFISGEDDPCMRSEDHLHRSAIRMVHAGYSDVTSAIYGGMRHEVLNETEKEYVWNDILRHITSWLHKP